MSTRISIATALAGLLVLAAGDAAARDYDPSYDQIGGYGAGTLDERVAKLEKRLSGEAMMEMLNRMEQLQTDVLRLRGEVEELNHALDTVKQQQKAMYSDLEQRLQGGATPATPAPEDAQSPPEAAASPAGESPVAPPAGASTPSSVAPPPAPIAPAPPPKPAAAPPPVDAGAARQAAYQKGLNLLKDGKYPESVREFKSFLAAYPSGENSDNAQYWLGEAYYVLRDFTAAREAYRKLVRDFPQSAKVADAQLKLGYIEYDTGQWAKARELLSQVVKIYPGTGAATQASKRLAKMKQEGR
jgi:tol-pal system protein YbgF